MLGQPYIEFPALFHGYYECSFHNIHCNVSLLADCPANFYPIWESCYLFDDGNEVSFSAGQTYCSNNGGKLADIETSDELKSIITFLEHSKGFSFVFTF